MHALVLQCSWWKRRSKMSALLITLPTKFNLGMMMTYVVFGTWPKCPVLRTWNANYHFELCCKHGLTERDIQHNKRYICQIKFYFRTRIHTHYARAQANANHESDCRDNNTISAAMRNANSSYKTEVLQVWVKINSKKRDNMPTNKRNNQEKNNCQGMLFTFFCQGYPGNGSILTRPRFAAGGDMQIS